MEGEGAAGRGSGTSTREAEGEQGSCEEPHTGRGEGPGASDQAGGSPVTLLSSESLNTGSFLVVSCYGNFEAGGGTGKRPGLHPESQSCGRSESNTTRRRNKWSSTLRGSRVQGRPEAGRSRWGKPGPVRV